MLPVVGKPDESYVLKEFRIFVKDVTFFELFLWYF
jgi:hypothetical protein